MSKPAAWIRLASLSTLSLTLALTLVGCSAASSASVRTPTATPETTVPCTVSSPVTAPALAPATPPVTLSVPNAPFDSVASADGRWIFVSVDSPSSSSPNQGIAVLRRGGESATVQHLIPLSPSPAGEALTHDGKLLIVANGNSVAVLDVAKAESGQANAVLGTVPTGGTADTIEVSVSLDDHYVFATDEHEQPRARGDMTVIDLQRALTGVFSVAAIVGNVPLSYYPVGMALAPDGRDLYVTSEIYVPASSPFVPVFPVVMGSLSVVDVARAESDPQHAVIAQALAGCHPVRIVLSPTGDVAWVTAREANAVLAFDTTKLASDPTHALLATVPVGPAPVGIALVDNGAGLLVACSNRFASPTAPQSVMLLDTQRALHGQSAVVGSIPVAAFPREFSWISRSRW